MAATVKVKVRVLDGWAVYDGKRQRSGGEQLEVDAALADEWLAAGLAELVVKKAPRKRAS